MTRRPIPRSQTERELGQLRLKHEQTGFRLYDGFEPSGRMHIAQGVFKAMNVNRCLAAGGTFAAEAGASVRKGELTCLRSGGKKPAAVER